MLVDVCCPWERASGGGELAGTSLDEFQLRATKALLSERDQLLARLLELQRSHSAEALYPARRRPDPRPRRRPPPPPTPGQQNGTARLGSSPSQQARDGAVHRGRSI